MLLDLHDAALEALVEPSRAFHERFQTMLPTSPPDLSTPEGLAAARDIAGAWSGAATDRPPVEAEDRVVRAGGREVGVRIFHPKGAARGVVLDIHGGGFYLGAASMGDARNAQLRDEGLAVVSVEYRLAPEHPWPAGPDDCETAARWVLEQAAAELGSDRVLVQGGSAGATLAVVTLLRIRDRLGAMDRVVGANLIYGVYDLSGTSPSGGQSVDSRRYYLEAYLRDLPPTERTQPEVSPLFADLHDLGPALFSVGDQDTLYEDNLALAARWAGAGNPTELVVYPGAPHGFNVFPTPMAKEANRRIRGWVSARFP